MAEIPAIMAIVIALISAVFSGLFVTLLKRRWSSQDRQCEMVEEMESKLEYMQKALWRVQKTVLIMAKILDEQTERNHPELNTNLEDIASELLGDDSGKPNKS
tara:strand:- start:757 stop:1065 length:309 start_codon:yes stop_codon:yes gene_type:complete